jgi:hypothetical protein
MADEKKPEAKPYTPAGAGEVFSEIIGIFLLLIIIGSILGNLSGFFNSSSASGNAGGLSWFSRFTEKGSITAKSKPLSELANPIGMRAITLNNTDVYDSPGGKKIGSHKTGDSGRILQGPVTVDGVRYWYVDYDTDPDGWVSENDIRSLTEPVSSIDNPVGASVMNTTDADVYDQSGNKIGSHKAGDKGKITRGPIYINGEKYWYVDYEDGTDGWVKESDIGATIGGGQSFFGIITSRLISLIGALKYLSYLISLLAIMGVAYLWVQVDTLRKKENELYYPKIEEEVNKVDPKWKRILALSDSINDSDWRLAIIESDIMLADLLDKLNLSGDTIGDKLKQLDKSDFRTLDNAWEAHKVRNQIAHDGPEFLLTQREVRRVIALYQSVFEEFEMI